MISKLQYFSVFITPSSSFLLINPFRMGSFLPLLLVSLLQVMTQVVLRQRPDFCLLCERSWSLGSSLHRNWGGLVPRGDFCNIPSVANPLSSIQQLQAVGLMAGIQSTSHLLPTWDLSSSNTSVNQKSNFSDPSVF